jgi:beta-lactamase superfamily II metal-dependent hydrolase
MAGKPTQVTIRAYDVGFGDCFLLSFQYASESRSVLIDFGSTRLPTGKTGQGKYLERIAKQIKADCGDRLTAVVATHRHKDHISGFDNTGTKSPGAIIRALKPEIVLQPWTEDPDAARDAKKPTARSRGARLQRNLMLRNLENMNHFAGFAHKVASRLRGNHLRATREQLSFLGDDNELKNRDAIVNLMTMGKRKARYLHTGAPSGLEALLPGVKVHVLGPPTLEQEPRIKTQTNTQADEFWHLRANFWARRGAIAKAHKGATIEPLFPRHVVHRRSPPWYARWYCYYAQIEQAEALLSIVRTLDNAMNNTSLILLFEVGDTCLLFPGDAQWENWRYALGQEKYQKLLKRVNVYKVGHHGSLNATPKTLWKGFDHKGSASSSRRLMSLLSTKDHVHGKTDETAVPRATLVKALKANSTLIDTRDAKPSELSKNQTINL